MGFLVVATDPHHSDFSGELEELAAIGAQFQTAQCKTEEDVAEACRDADGILVTFSPVGRRALAAMPRCRIVVRTGVGYDRHRGRHRAQGDGRECPRLLHQRGG